LFVEVQRVNLNWLIHGVPKFELLDGRPVVGEDRSELDCLRHHLSLIVNALTLNVQNELLVGVLRALKSKFLRKDFISVWSEHHIDGLALSWLQCAAVRPDLEPFNVVASSLR